MPIKISPKIVGEPPEDERKDVVKWLEAKSWGLCYLCQRPVDVEDDDLVADHDLVRASGGPSTRNNLNVAHARCNGKKGGLTTEQARAIFSVEAFLEENGPGLRYGEILDYFEITPHAVTLEESPENVSITVGHGKKISAAVYKESNKQQRTFHYAFLELPQDVIFNDDYCQPRAIKPHQIRQIYLDLYTNPLHEPPSCRVSDAEPKSSKRKLLMFDGQHKTIASWMLGRKHIVAKIYLDLELNEAVSLVNSIQAKIKKLPLTPFELVTKLDQEHKAKFQAYLAATSAADASEDGFVQSLDVVERPKARQGLEAAVILNVIEGDETLLLYKMQVQGDGLPDGQKRLTEAAFKNEGVQGGRWVAAAPTDLSPPRPRRRRGS